MEPRVEDSSEDVASNVKPKLDDVWESVWELCKQLEWKRELRPEINGSNLEQVNDNWDVNNKVEAEFDAEDSKNGKNINFSDCERDPLIE